MSSGGIHRGARSRFCIAASKRPASRARGAYAASPRRSGRQLFDGAGPGLRLARSRSRRCASEGHDAPQSAGVGPPARARAQSGVPLFDRAVRGLPLARSRAPPPRICRAHLSGSKAVARCHRSWKAPASQTQTQTRRTIGRLMRSARSQRVSARGLCPCARSRSSSAGSTAGR